MSIRALHGCLLGTAVGDALGLPYEGLSARRAAKLLGPPDRHRFLFGRGMISDDTEHTVIVAESLIASAGDVRLFETQLGKRLRRWFLTLPAGIGMATAKACCKLLFGVSPKKSGVFSAGNGPAMRSAILGVFAENDEQLADLVRAATRVTHTDPKAEVGAFAVALAAHLSKSGQPVEAREYFSRLGSSLQVEGSDEFVELIQKAVESAEQKETTAEFAAEMGLTRGVGGYVYHSVPVVIHCWLTHQVDFRSATESIISCGGDCDTNASMVGGIIGASVGAQAIPSEWARSLILFPMSDRLFENLAAQLHHAIETGEPGTPPSSSWSATLLRNLFFLVAVLAHGFRRLAPPY